jgi:hypothetical protein
LSQLTLIIQTFNNDHQQVTLHENYHRNPNILTQFTCPLNLINNSIYNNSNSSFNLGFSPCINFCIKPLTPIFLCLAPNHLHNSPWVHTKSKIRIKFPKAWFWKTSQKRDGGKVSIKMEKEGKIFVLVS